MQTYTSSAEHKSLSFFLGVGMSVKSSKGIAVGYLKLVYICNLSLYSSLISIAISPSNKYCEISEKTVDWNELNDNLLFNTIYTLLHFDTIKPPLGGLSRSITVYSLIIRFRHCSTSRDLLGSSFVGSCPLRLMLGSILLLLKRLERLELHNDQFY